MMAVMTAEELMYLRKKLRKMGALSDMEHWLNAVSGWTEIGRSIAKRRSRAPEWTFEKSVIAVVIDGRISGGGETKQKMLRSGLMM